MNSVAREENQDRMGLPSEEGGLQRADQSETEEQKKVSVRHDQ